MPALKIFKTNFTAGEVMPDLLGRGDLRAFDNGARKLRNVFIAPTGGVRRRAGLAYIDAARGPGRLISFEFNTEQVYLLVFTDGWIDVYRDGAKTAEIAAPWTAAQIAQIGWTQSADTLLVTHPDVEPRKITRTSHTDWTIAPWSFYDDGAIIRQPYHKFAADAVTLQAGATSGTVALTASAAVFSADYVNTRLRIKNKEVLVTGYTSPTQLQANVKQTLDGTAAEKDWEEQAFSSLRGWPVSLCFHQDRLVIGGSRDLPNRLWLSKSSDLFNFDLGTGLDDESIEFAMLSDQVNAVRAVFSGRHLQVFTSGAEWMVTGEPLTPGNIQIKRQTRVGSPIDRRIPPCDVDGATIFAARSGVELREFLFTDVEQAYQSNDLALLARHLINDPVDLDYDAEKRLIHIVMGDGSLGTVTNYRGEQVTAWTLQTTDGNFLSVALVGREVYLLVERNASVFIERFDEALNTDAALLGESETVAADWSGLDHLEGRTVTIAADGAAVGLAQVADGSVLLDTPARKVEIGLPFTHEIEPLPPVLGGTSGQGVLARLIRATFRLLGTACLRVDTGRGFVPAPFRNISADSLLDSGPARFSGDIALRALGWRRDATQPLWRIAQDDPLPCTVLSVTTEMKASE